MFEKLPFAAVAMMIVLTLITRLIPHVWLYVQLNNYTASSVPVALRLVRFNHSLRTSDDDGVDNDYDNDDERCC